MIQLLEHFGTQLQLESEKDKGARFYFDLPTDIRSIKKSQTTQNELVQQGILAAGSLLILDDDEQITELYRYHFQPLVKTLVVANQLEDISSISSGPFDIVITDFKLGKDSIRDNWHYLEKITNSNSLTYLISAKQVNEKELNSPIPITACLLKPIDNSKLINRISRDLLIRKYGLPNTASIKKDYDFQPEKYTRALRLLVSEWTTFHQQLPKAIAAGDYDTFYNITHKMITSIRRLDLKMFETLLGEIQQDFYKPGFDTQNKGTQIKEAISFYLSCINQEIQE